jgi:type VI secretion system secreted protein VgrG
MNKAQSQRIAELQGKGFDFSTASKMAARETADKYGLAYFEGRSGVFNRVNP